MHLALPKDRSNFVAVHLDFALLGLHIHTHHGPSTEELQVAGTSAVDREAEGPAEEVAGCSQRACIAAVLAFGAAVARN